MPLVWIDLDNSPHVLFFEPLVRELADRGCDVSLTAKPHAQTLELLTLRNLTATVVGRANPRRWLSKVAATLERATALALDLRHRPRAQLLLTHGSRSGVLAARALGVPAWTFLDYEHVEARSLLIGTTRFFLPDLLDGAQLPRAIRQRATFYSGLKENLYLDLWQIDPERARREAGIPDGFRWVVSRPPAMAAHYASPASWHMWERVTRTLLEDARVIVDVIPRDGTQGDEVRRTLGQVHGLRVTRGAHDGPSMIAAADLVVGGGGTMNREAAVLGTPVWSVFSGPTPHIDRCLSQEGRLTWVHSERDLSAALGSLWKRPKPRGGGGEGRALITEEIWSAVSRHFEQRRARSKVA